MKLLLFLNTIMVQSQTWAPQPAWSQPFGTIPASVPQSYATFPVLPPVSAPVVKTTVSSAPAITTKEDKPKDAKKEAEAAEKKRKDQWEAQQGIIDARLVDRARDLDVFGAGNLRNGILTNPLVADTAIGVAGFGGANGNVIKAGSFLTRVMSRRRVARSYQRQIDRYVPAHPEPTKADFNTVAQWRAKRNENTFIGDAQQVNMVSSFVTRQPLLNGLTAVNSANLAQADQQGSIAARQAFELAKDKFLKNTSDVAARQTFNQARDFKQAKINERQGSQANRVNAVLPLLGGSKSSLLTQYGVLNAEKGNLAEKNIARRQLNIAQQKMDADPSEDNWWKLKLARATFDWRDQFEQSARSRGLRTVATGLPSLWSNIFRASETLRYKDLIAAQKRISRITLAMRKRAYAKKYEGADETQTRMLALNSYGKPRNF
jgi:hypothetical protein